MHLAAYSLAALLASGIIVIGAQYVLAPWNATRSFGLPLPEPSTNTGWWLRLKGVRDVASGLTVFALMIWGGGRIVGIFLLVAAVIPFGDMSITLAAKGSRARAFWIHGLTLLLMVLAGVTLVIGME
jgi:hypothetical protein